MRSDSDRNLAAGIGLGLVLVTLAVYWPAGGFGFVNYDDPSYVEENKLVQGGFTLESIGWAFTGSHASNWHPLTWMSHMLDWAFFGANPSGHHWVNVLFHVANSVLLFLVLRQATHATGRSGFVAALFALHPLHVESVAWIAERKDVLSTLFWILTMGAYVRYVENGRRAKWWLALLFFTFGLLSKTMLVTLPLVLLLLDFWPLRRIHLAGSSGTEGSGAIGNSGHSLMLLVWEKVPFLALAAGASVVTFWAQKTGGAVAPWSSLSPWFRVENALVSYVRYLGKTFWPKDLSVIYGLPEEWASWKVLAAFLAMASVTFAAIRLVRTRPYFLVGWLWYLGTLVPAIGLVHVGNQAMADRFTYVPLIGIFIVVAWGACDLAAYWPRHNLILGAAAALVMGGCVVATGFQLQHWKNGETLFRHAVAATRNNHVACNYLAIALAKQGKNDEALTYFHQALQLRPHYADAHNNLGFALAQQGKVEEGVLHYHAALAINPNSILARNNLALALAGQRKYGEAETEFSQLLRLKPNDPDTRYNLANALMAQGKFQQAAEQFQQLLRLNPNDAEARQHLAAALSRIGK